MEHYNIVPEIDMRKVVELTVVAMTPKYSDLGYTRASNMERWRNNNGKCHISISFYGIRGGGEKRKSVGAAQNPCCQAFLMLLHTLMALNAG